MASMDERMRALRDKFQRGEIDAETFGLMLDSLLGIVGTGGQSVNDAVVGGDVEQSQGKIEGGVHIHGAPLPGGRASASEEQAEAAQRSECPHCSGSGICEHAVVQRAPLDVRRRGKYECTALMECSRCGMGVILTYHRSGRAFYLDGRKMSEKKIWDELTPPVCRVCEGKGLV